ASAGMLLLLETRTGRVLHSEHYRGDLGQTGISPDGRLFFNATGIDPLTAFDTGTLQMKWRAAGVPNEVFSMRISPDGALLGVVSSDGVLRVVDTSSGNVVRTTDGGIDGDVGFSRDNELVSVLPASGWFRAWAVRIEEPGTP